MNLVRLYYPRIRTLNAAVCAVSKNPRPEYYRDVRESAVAFPLSKAPSLLELKKMGKTTKMELGVEVDLEGEDHLVIFGGKNKTQFTYRDLGRFLRIHNHPDPGYILPSSGDEHQQLDLQTVVTRMGLTFAMVIEGAWSTRYNVLGRGLGQRSVRNKYLGCEGLEDRPYRFLMNPKRRFLEYHAEKRFAWRREEIMEVLEYQGYPSISIVFDSYHKFSTRCWFYRWSDIVKTLGIELKSNDITALLNRDGTIKDFFAG